MTAPADSVRERLPLSRERIVTAAVEMADHGGVAALSMRRLAAQLGYEVMSLYNHVANKDDLLDHMVDLVAAEIGEPSAATGWKDAARQISVSAHEALRRHPWAAPLWSTRWPGPNRWRHMESLLRVLAHAGLPEDLTDLGFHALTLHIQGFTQQQISYNQSTQSQEQRQERFAATADADAWPYLVAHMRYHRNDTQARDEFGFVLDLILDGLERAAPSTGGTDR